MKSFKKRKEIEEAKQVGPYQSLEDFYLGVDLFKQILTMEQEELHFYTLGKIENYYPREDIYYMDKEFIYAKGNIPVLLCAHLDTVHPTKPDLDTIFHDVDKGVMWSPLGIGGDDRCGVFNIFDILARGYLPHVIFSWDEEIGGVGASHFVESSEKYFGESISEKISEINFAIQFDRHGFSEAVYYELDSPQFESYISSFGFKTEWGSYTDISEYCPAFGFAGVNVAAGYVNEHTNIEMIFLGEMLESQRKVLNILEDQVNSPEYFEYIELPTATSWRGWENYTSPSSYSFAKDNSYYFDDVSDGKDYTIDDGHVDDPYCQECQYCMQTRGVVPWTYHEDPILDTLCNECREVFQSESGI